MSDIGLIEDELKNLIIENADIIFHKAILGKEKGILSLCMDKDYFPLALLKKWGLGSDFENKPAHVEVLRNCLGNKIIPEIVNVIDGNECENVEDNIRFVADNTFSMRIYGRTDLSLEINGNEGYVFKAIKKNSRSGMKSITISGKPSHILTTTESYGTNGEMENDFSRDSLDKNGFVTKTEFVIGDLKGVLIREGNQVYFSDGKSVTWDGNPVILNYKEPSKEEIKSNVKVFGSKYPNVSAYYKKVFGGFGDDEKFEK